MIKLDFSIPANNQKIVELYNKLKKGELDPNPVYQRKLVWKKQHKFNFINTILLNFPFPEIYVAPGILDTDSLELKDQIVDGQQRLTTIKNYIENVDVFGLMNITIPKFSDLTKSQKEDFLNYEVSVRYLKNANVDQIRDIFQRINSTEYALNRTERINAQWGESEFICFAKQMVENDLDIDSTLINYKLSAANRTICLNFFHADYNIFSDNDVNRMLALQYALTLLATILNGRYFRRNDKVQDYIERYYEEFADAGEVETRLVETILFINSLRLQPKSYWFNKANIFTLIIEIYKFDVSNVSVDLLSEALRNFEDEYIKYIESERSLYQFGISDDNEIVIPDVDIENIGTIYQEFPQELVKYYDYAKEGVNEVAAREFRGTTVKEILSRCVISKV